MTGGHGAFFDALFDVAADVPAGLTHPEGADTAARFAVYRNNVVFGLMQNLRDGFPLTRTLLGEAMFDGLAGAYVRAEPPRDPLMFAYGEMLPEFATHFAALADMPYAADVLALEVAMRRAARAIDSRPARPQDIKLRNPLCQGLSLAPALHVLAADWPLHDLHLFLSGQTDNPPDMSRPQEVMVCRDESHAVHVALLPAGAAQFVTALQAGRTLAVAAENQTEAAMTETLTCLLAAGAVLAVTKVPAIDDEMQHTGDMHDAFV